MRRQERLSADWLFHLGEVENGGYQGLDDSDWQRVTLPHDWSVTQPFSESCASGTGYLPGGVGWYRRHFSCDPQGGRVTVTFGGVHKNSRCFINSNYLGMRPNGYSTFSYDITEFIKPGDNVLCVRAERNELADSRWYTGCGITRDVTLTVTDSCCFEDDGIFAHTDECDESRAVITVEWRAREKAEALFELFDADGVCVSDAKDAGCSGSVRMVVEHPRLWSPESPALYTLRASLYADGKELDRVELGYGIRAIRFDADKGFFLNNRPMKLKGVCVHHDAGALGAAVPDIVWQRRLLKLKTAGCNAIRFSHNPPDPSLLDLCDRLGLMAIDEAFDEWEGCKNKWWQGHNVYPPKHYGYAFDFPTWHEADLSAMVLRDRNHPSVIMWSVGNEIDYPNDPYVHPMFETMTGNNDANKPAQERAYDPFKPNAERLTTVARELCGIVKRLDPTRPTNSALAFPELSVPTGYAAELDVVGFNYKEALYEQTHREHPEFALLGTENHHSTEAWLAVKRNEFIAGQFLWTGIDFLGEARGWPVRASYSGMLNLAGFEKPLFERRRAMWTDAPMARLAASAEGDIYAERFAWDFTPGQEITVACYTNCERAELFINGLSLGVRALTDEDGCRAEWKVPFEAGELRVQCHTGEALSAADALFTPGDAAEVGLDATTCDGIAQVELRLTDANGVTLACRDQIVYCEAEGAELMGIENGNPADLTPYSASHRSTYCGQAIVYLRLQGGVKATLTVTTESGIQSVLEIG